MLEIEALCSIDRGDLQFDGGAGVSGPLNGVLFSRKLINHVVAHQAVFIALLSGACLLSLCWAGLWTFNLVARNGAANDTNHGGQCAAFAFAHGISNGTAGNGAHGGPCARCLHWRADLSLRTNLARDRNLLVDRRSAEHVADFLGLSR